MRVCKEVVLRADGEGVTLRAGRVPERRLHRGWCAKHDRGGYAQMPALVSQRDYRCCQCLCMYTVCACRGWKREPEALGF